MCSAFRSVWIVFFSGIFLAGCRDSDGREEEMMAQVPGGDQATVDKSAGFSEGLLGEFTAWTPVLKGDKAFESRGHGGVFVRVYLNPTAKEHIEAKQDTYPMASGTILAKAVVATVETPVSEASRVYFMMKKAPGFDPLHNDWSYAVANKVNGKLIFDESIKPRDDLCISCHSRYSAFDYVQTVDFFKRQSTGS
ncbi:MAG TPA: cytochrome P460 family protein [Oligoflexus sp.]|uniref:cytochrome P460 family protein n=1 Tax=Oligoflexus sp. TaxID=1971216 RepID=UPI002D738D68|nr:cytochrome P460 family protein [Oligoflexus sp.]HYX32870.1 cytochrome P460 family protein [Oligoflexus sp.]